MRFGFNLHWYKISIPQSSTDLLLPVTSCSTLRGLRRRCRSPPSSRTTSPARPRTRTSSSCPRREPATSRMSSGSRLLVLRQMSRYKQPHRHRGTSNVKECCSLQFGIRKSPNHHQKYHFQTTIQCKCSPYFRLFWIMADDDAKLEKLLLTINVTISVQRPRAAEPAESWPVLQAGVGAERGQAGAGPPRRGGGAVLERGHYRDLPGSIVIPSYCMCLKIFVYLFTLFILNISYICLYETYSSVCFNKFHRW